MPHPASSGTGYLTVAAWMQLMGEAEAWKFMDALHQNIAVYTHSGSAPCVQAAKGERVAGISFDMRAARGEDAGRADRDRLARRGHRLGHGGRSPSSRARKKADAAKKVADWAATKAANELYSKYLRRSSRIPTSRTCRRTIRPTPRRAWPRSTSQKMADDRERVLAEWSKRYDAKAAPKN